MPACISRKAAALGGTARVPGDKSISHRALILAALAAGKSRITGLLEGGDVMRTAGAVAALGAHADRLGPGDWRVCGVGIGGLRPPDTALDMGNAGTGARLLMGVAATHPLTLSFVGDESLSARPMDRVLTPISLFGARSKAAEGGRLPVTITGARHPLPQTYEMPVPSAQVKSAFLLAALNVPGVSTLIEPTETRDHSERMLAAFGAKITSTRQSNDDGSWGRRIEITGQPELVATEIVVPRDFSSAAFPLVAATLVPGSRVCIPDVGVNPLRCGLLDVLGDMGAAVDVRNRREAGGEEIGDLVVRAAALTGVTPDPALAPRLIDEYPLLFAAAACASGTSTFRGLAELRLKECDRIKAMARGLAGAGVSVAELDDGIVIEGCGGPPRGGVTVAARHDHRIAMALLVLGAVAAKPVAVDDTSMIATSFPGFAELMNGLGCRMGESP